MQAEREYMRVPRFGEAPERPEADEPRGRPGWVRWWPMALTVLCIVVAFIDMDILSWLLGTVMALCVVFCVLALCWRVVRPRG